MLKSVAARHLLEVLHTAFDERLIREVRDVAIEPSARTLGVAHLAEHRPSGLVMPSMDSTLPLGLTERSIDGLPSASTYCVATWPFAISFSISSGACHKAALTMADSNGCECPPTLHSESHGESDDATRVRTRRL